MASCPWRGSTLSAGRPWPGRRGVAACRDSEGPGRKRPGRRHRQHPPMAAHAGAGRHQAPTRGPRGRQQFGLHGPAETPGTPPPCTGTRDGTALSPAQVDVLRALLPPTRSRSVGPSSFSATPRVRARHEIRHLLRARQTFPEGRRGTTRHRHVHYLPLLPSFSSPRPPTDDTRQPERPPRSERVGPAWTQREGGRVSLPQTRPAVPGDGGGGDGNALGTGPEGRRAAPHPAGLLAPGRPSLA